MVSDHLIVQVRTSAQNSSTKILKLHNLVADCSAQVLVRGAADEALSRTRENKGLAEVHWFAAE